MRRRGWLVVASFAFWAVLCAGGNGPSLRAQGITFQILHNLALNEGSKTAGSLLRTPDGMVYGVSQAGGTNGDGTVFKIAPDGSITVIHHFDGETGVGGLAVGMDGAFYGVGQSTQASLGWRGLAFRLALDGTYTVIHYFDDRTEGSNPFGPLVVDSAGVLYGVTANNGPNGGGTVFKLLTDGTLTTLHAFSGLADGANPQAGLTMGRDGRLYGSVSGTLVGGRVGGLFSVMTDASEFKVLYSFAPYDQACNCYPTGGFVYSPLVETADGIFLGVTNGGLNNTGTVFSITSTGTFTLLHTFAGVGSDGAPLEGSGPSYGGLRHGTDGRYYGTTCCGAPLTNLGFSPRIFAFDSNTGLTVLRSLSPTDGQPLSGLSAPTFDGTMLGVTYSGGSLGNGIVYALNVPSVCQALTIVAPPQAVTIDAGGAATVSVTVSGSNPKSYQWYFGSPANSTPIAGATSSSVQISPTSTTSVWVRVSNPCDTADSDVAVITVNPPWPPPSKPAIDYFALGDSIASGHGLMDPGSQNDPCRRSPFAYSAVVAAELSKRFTLKNNSEGMSFACSGARVNGVLFEDFEKSRFKSFPSQVTEVLLNLDNRPTLVTISVGANDFGWSDIGTFLDLLYEKSDRAFIKTINEMADRVRISLTLEVARLLQQPNVSVILTQYHNPANATSVFFRTGRWEGRCGIVGIECADRMKYVVDTLNAAVGSVVVSGLSDSKRLRLATVNEAFKGHEGPSPTCGATVLSAETWIQYPDDIESNSFPFAGSGWLKRGLFDGLATSGISAKDWTGDCIHPNKKGAGAYANGVLDAFAKLGW